MCKDFGYIKFEDEDEVEEELDEEPIDVTEEFAIPVEVTVSQ